MSHSQLSDATRGANNSKSLFQDKQLSKIHLIPALTHCNAICVSDNQKIQRPERAQDLGLTAPLRGSPGLDYYNA